LLVSSKLVENASTILSDSCVSIRSCRGSGFGNTGTEEGLSVMWGTEERLKKLFCIACGYTTILQVSARYSLYVVRQTTKEHPAPKATDTGVALDDDEFCCACMLSGIPSG